MNRTFVSRAFDRSRLQTDDKFDVPTFGKPTSNNHGWVKCDSRSFPGMSYYFNVITCCSTWDRPVPTFVATPYFRPDNRPSEEEFTDRTPLEVSDIEDDDEDEQRWDLTKDPKSSFISKKEAKQKKIYAEVLYKMYHCYGDEWNIDVMNEFASIETEQSFCKCELNNENASSNDFQSILPEICYSSSSKSESSDSNSTISRSIKSRIQSDSLDSASTLIVKRTNTFERMGKKLDDLGYRKNFNTGFMIDRHRSRLADDLENDNCNIHLKINDRDKPSMMSISNSEDSDKNSREMKISSGDDEENDKETDEEEEENDGEEEEEDNNNNEHYNCQFSLPKLKTIQFSDLLTSPRKVKIAKKNLRRKRDRNDRVKIEKNSENISPKRVKKMIYEVNGLKTINYDFITPELPPGVKMSNLSDSGSSTICNRRYSLYDREKLDDTFLNWTKIKRKKISENDFMDVKEPDLSDSSTRSTNSYTLRRDTRNDRSKISRATKDSETSSSSSSSSNSKKRSKKFVNVNRDDRVSESDSSETSSTSSSNSAKSLENRIKKLPDIDGFVVKKENLDNNESSISDPKEQNFDESSKVCTYNTDDVYLDSSTSITSPSNTSDVTWKLSDTSESDED